MNHCTLKKNIHVSKSKSSLLVRVISLGSESIREIELFSHKCRPITSRYSHLIRKLP